MSAHTASKIIRRAKRPKRDGVNMEAKLSEMRDWLKARELAPKSALRRK